MSNIPRYTKIQLPCGRTTIVDSLDYVIRLKNYNWCASESNGKVYVMTRTGGKRMYLHRLVMDAPDGLTVDHRNGDGLDNRRTGPHANLRLATRSQNQANQRKQEGCSSRYKGVSWYPAYGKWLAYVGSRKLGYFTDEEDAARAYDREALKKWGDFSVLNFPDRARFEQRHQRSIARAVKHAPPLPDSAIQDLRRLFGVAA